MSTLMSLDPTLIAVAVFAVLMTGLSKSGFAGALAMLGTPMLALVMPPVQAAATMLPVLVVMDMIGLIVWRRTVKWSIIRQTLPGAVLGIAIGWATAAFVSDAFIRLLVGIIALVFGITQLVRLRRSSPARKENAVGATGWGTIAGFTSFVAHAGGPPFSAYVLPLNLDKQLVVGTGTVFFATVNTLKLVPYFALGQFTSQNLTLSALLVPAAIIGVLVGVWAVRRVSQTLFYTISYVGMVPIGLKLVYDGLSAMLG